MDWEEIKARLKSADITEYQNLVQSEKFWSSDPKDIFKIAFSNYKYDQYNTCLFIINRIEERKKDLDQEVYLNFKYLQGDIFHDLEKYEEAVKCYSDILLIKEDDTNYNNRALAYWELEKYEEALNDYLKAIKLNPSNVTAQRGVGEMLIKFHKPKEAIPYLLEAVKLEPTYAAAFRTLGIAYYNIEDWPKSQSYKAFKKAIELDPNNEIYLKEIKKMEEHLNKAKNLQFWFKVSFRLMDAPQLHEEIISILGEGTECHKKGDPRPTKPGETWPNDIWFIDTPISENEDIAKHLLWLIEFIAPHEEQIKKWMAAGARADIFFSYSCNENHRGFGLSPDLLSVFSRLGLRLEVSVMT